MIQLNYRDAKPIYEQIKDGLRKLVTRIPLLQMKSCPRAGNGFEACHQSKYHPEGIPGT